MPLIVAFSNIIILTKMSNFNHLYLYLHELLFLNNPNNIEYVRQVSLKLMYFNLWDIWILA